MREFVLTDRGADALLEMERSDEVYALPDDFTSHLVTSPEEAVQALKNLSEHRSV